MLSLLIIHSCLNEDLGLKMLIITSLCVAFSAYITIYPIFRCMSSSYLYLVGMWTITANMFLGYLKSANYDAQALVDSNMNALLIAVNVAAGIILCLMIFIFVLFKLTWPVNLKTVKSVAVGYRYLLADLRNAQKMILILRARSNYQFVKAEPILQMIQILKDHYYLLYSENHHLQYTVLEQLDLLDYLKKRVQAVTLLPCKKLEDSYGLLIKVVNRRWKEQILMTPVKRRLLLKLYILKMFIGDRYIQPFNSGDINNYIGKGDTKRPIGISDFEIDQLYDKIESVLIEKLDSDPENSHRGLVFGNADADSDLWLISNIHKAQDNDNLDWLVDLTEKAIESGSGEANSILMKIWDERGTMNLPEDLRMRLYQPSY